MVDSIPIRLAPLPGEDLDSYLHAYARLLHAEVSDILTLAGLAGQPSTEKLGHRPWTYRLDPVERAALATVTGLRPQTLTAMTLARYDDTGLLSGVRPTGRPRPPRWWNQLKGSRFCPRCLAGNGGRWMLAWRLPWTFACTRHHLLLVDTCLACGRAHRPALDQPPRDPGTVRHHRPAAPVAPARTPAARLHGPTRRHRRGRAASRWSDRHRATSRRQSARRARPQPSWHRRPAGGCRAAPRRPARRRLRHPRRPHRLRPPPAMATPAPA
ncbi:hypothetical protein E0F15_00905 [Frankia sp. B2]|uniref:TniQ family protein n=1 Tax=Frankia sp. B2 TaxID=2541730 RepID=UPI00106C48D8|nr:TniQ family protein [Frankia sp. B2]TFE35453.1 hypothetical protein E0F15_00905 [Frankia sp. B2]